MKAEDKKDVLKTRQTLLEKIRDKYDENSWEDFVYYYKNFIYMLCRRMKLSHHDSEEVVQKVLIVIWNKLPEFKYDKNQKFKGWLYRVTRNNVRDFYKKIFRHNAKIDNAAKAFLNEEENFSKFDEVAEEEWKSYIASMALDNIRDKYADNVIEVFIRLSEGGTPASVAQEMNLPPNTVSVYKKRVTAQLCREIRRLNHELG